MGRQRIQLPFQRMAALVAWIQAQREVLLEKRPTKADVARRASKDLGFDVTENNVEAAMKHAGVKYHALGRQPGLPGGLTKAVVAPQRALVMETARLAISLAEQLGVRASAANTIAALDDMEQAMGRANMPLFKEPK